MWPGVKPVAGFQEQVSQERAQTDAVLPLMT